MSVKINEEIYYLAKDRARGFTGVKHLVAKDNLSEIFNEKFRDMTNEEELSAYNKGKKAEKNAWLKGKRCHFCGNKKEQNLSDVCDKCWEEEE